MVKRLNEALQFAHRVAASPGERKPKTAGRSLPVGTHEISWIDRHAASTCTFDKADQTFETAESLLNVMQLTDDEPAEIAIEAYMPESLAETNGVLYPKVRVTPMNSRRFVPALPIVRKPPQPFHRCIEFS
jgi:hypothetical protein